MKSKLRVEFIEKAGLESQRVTFPLKVLKSPGKILQKSPKTEKAKMPIWILLS